MYCIIFILDYIKMNDFVVTFSPEEVTKTIEITIINDEVPESDEIFTAYIFGVSTRIATVTNPSTATITIEDNDSMYNLILMPSELFRKSM